MNKNGVPPVEFAGPEPEQIGTREPVQTTSQIAEQAEQDKINGWVDKKLSDLGKTQGVIILVLAVGFVTLLIAVLGIVVQVWGFNWGVQREMVKAIDTQTSIAKESNEKTNALVNLLKLALSPSPSPSTSMKK